MDRTTRCRPGLGIAKESFQIRSSVECFGPGLLRVSGNIEDQSSEEGSWGVCYSELSKGDQVDHFGVSRDQPVTRYRDRRAVGRLTCGMGRHVSALVITVQCDIQPEVLLHAFVVTIPQHVDVVA